MKYTISEMAKLLGVTTHTLRYYEKEGVIQPVVNQENGYRYYAVLDTRRFNLCRMYRSMGFSMEESLEMLMWKSKEDLEHIGRQMERVLKDQERERIFLDARLEYMRMYRELVKGLTDKVGKLRVVQMEPMYRLAVADNENHWNSKELDCIKEEWLRFMPVTAWVSRIRKKMFEHYGQGELKYDFGIMISKKWADRLGIQRTCNVETISGGDYLMTIHKKTTRAPWGWEDIDYINDFLKGHDIRFWGDAYSTCIASSQDGEHVENYHCMFLKIFS